MTTPPPPNRPRTGLQFGILAAVLLALGGGAGAYWYHQRQEYMRDAEGYYSALKRVEAAFYSNAGQGASPDVVAMTEADASAAEQRMAASWMGWKSCGELLGAHSRFKAARSHRELSNIAFRRGDYEMSRSQLAQAGAAAEGGSAGLRRARDLMNRGK